MRILHALVSYLAVIALPFHPFALAFQLAAIDYDGYVNTTQNHIDGAFMKQALGTIVETCQTVTTQNHKDGTLMKRVPGDIIKARQWPGTPGVVLIPVSILTVVAIVLGVTVGLIWITEDDQVRGNDIL